MMTEYIYEVYDGGGAWSGRVLRGEIIRCRDCKHSRCDARYCAINELFMDGSDLVLVEPDGFCSWAERSE